MIIQLGRLYQFRRLSQQYLVRLESYFPTTGRKLGRSGKKHNETRYNSYI